MNDYMKNLSMIKTFIRLCIVFYLPVMLTNYILAEDLTLEMIFKYNLFTPTLAKDIHSMKDGVHYSVLENSKDIVKYSYATGLPIDTLFSIDWIEYFPFQEIISYSLSENETVIILGVDQEKIYRYSYKASYYIYNIQSKVIKPVFDEEKQKYTELSPDGSKVAFIVENNLFVKDIQSGILTQVTLDGSNEVINGAPDWLYEEEFDLKKGYYWSPDSRMLAYYRFDESPVHEYSLIFYKSLYPELYTYKYPLAGENNPQVDVYTYDLVQGETRKMEIARDSDCYIPRIQWLPASDQLCLTHLNRHQNKADLYLCDVSDGNSRLFHTEEDDKYISDVTDGFVSFIDSGKYAVILSERTSYKHLYLYSIDGELINPVTWGNWEVEKICGIDESTGKLYYTSTEVSPLERHLYSVNLDGTDKVQMTNEPGTHSAFFNTTFDYYILTSSDADTPFLIRLFNKQGELVKVLQNNDFVRDLTVRYNFTPKEFFTYRNKNNTELNAFRILPPEFRKNKKYPVLVYVYGGPESQMVKKSWDKRLAWFQLLAQKGYIVVCADNRGSDGRGQDFSKSIYMHLGNYEVEDQIALAEYMSEQSYVDKNRIGLFGWSYGGYMTLLCMTKGNYIFKTGVAVGPVTDWKFYDSAYTERFMGKPEDNKNGYWKGSALNYVEMIEGNLLLIHGLADDNVHFQHSAELLTRVKEENKHIDMFLYPNENHLMRGENALYHVYLQATEYILKNL